MTTRLPLEQLRHGGMPRVVRGRLVPLVHDAVVLFGPEEPQRRDRQLGIRDESCRSVTQKAKVFREGRGAIGKRLHLGSRGQPCAGAVLHRMQTRQERSVGRQARARSRVRLIVEHSIARETIEVRRPCSSRT